MQIYRSSVLQRISISNASGAESIYYRLDRWTGIKLIRTPFRSQDGYFKHQTVESLLSSPKWIEARRQYDLMEMLAKRKRSPHVYALVVVKYEEQHYDAFDYVPAIKMEHIDFTPNYGDMNSPSVKGKWRFVRYMQSAGWEMGDPHELNIVYAKNKKRHVIIDFGGIKKL